MKKEPVVLAVTTSSMEEAARIVKSGVEAGLAACGNILPEIRSIYRWKGETCDDPEVLILLKTERSRLMELMEKIKENHSYEVPEMIAIPVVDGWRPYLDWVLEETKPG